MDRGCLLLIHAYKKICVQSLPQLNSINILFGSCLCSDIIAHFSLLECRLSFMRIFGGLIYDAAGPTSRRASTVCITAPLRDVLLLFFPVGIVSQLSTGSIMTATENNMRSFHEEG